MSEIFPYSNPLRFYTFGTAVDYDTIKPTSDNMRPRLEYQKGIFTHNYYPEHSKGESMSFTVIGNTDNIPTLTNVNTGATFNPASAEWDGTTTPTYITPTGWGGTPVQKYEITFNEEGVYYWTIGADGVYYDSDEFVVKDWSETKDMIEIRYNDSRNGNGIFYNDSSGLKWDAKAYYTGYIEDENPSFEISSFTDEPNNTINVRSVPKLLKKVTLCNIHSVYLNNITYQMACNNIYVNGMQLTFESMSVENIKNSTLKNIVLNLSVTNNNGYQQIT